MVNKQGLAPTAPRGKAEMRISFYRPPYIFRALCPGFPFGASAGNGGMKPPSSSSRTAGRGRRGPLIRTIRSSCPHFTTASRSPTRGGNAPRSTKNRATVARVSTNTPNTVVHISGKQRRNSIKPRSHTSPLAHLSATTVNANVNVF